MSEPKTEVMISIIPPYTDMILSGYKEMELRRKILNVMYTYEGCRLYLYETKRNGGRGMVVGEAELKKIYELHYDDNYLETGKISDEKLNTERQECIQNMYMDWCKKHSVQPKENGWKNSARFLSYLVHIGWNEIPICNYALKLDNVKKYDIPLPISAFCNMSGITMKHPPQNMCQVKRIC